MIGSANMDRRSFDLSYENNILLFDPAMTADMQRLQKHYISKAAMVAGWPLRQRLWNNTLAMLGPLL